MRALKFISISLIVTIIAVWATKDSWLSKNIYVTFNSENTKDVAYKIYYSDTSNNESNVDTNFREKMSVRNDVPAGVNKVKITLPIEKVVHFRLDFGSNPGAIFISDLRLIGDKVIDFNNFEKFIYTSAVEKHEVIDNKLHIISNQNTPYMFYNEKLDVNSGITINWTKLIQIILGTFLLIIGLLLTRKKTRGTENKTTK